MGKKKIRKLIFSDLLLLLCFVLLNYPMFSDIWNAQHSSRMYSEYKKSVSHMDTKEYQTILKSTKDYNKTLVDKGNSRFRMSEQEENDYMKLLNLPDTDVMAYLKIEKIGMKHMPVYHTTKQEVLQAGAGHFEGSSLPVGGKGTHSVLSGHTGMSGSPMFSKLTQLKKGDIFQIKVLDRTLTYQVDQIHTVLPKNVKYLQIDKDKDYCTLITCTPMGINSHRLLVRGKRIPNPKVQKVQKEKQNFFKQIWERLISRFATYELVMTGFSILILIFFLLPDMKRLICQTKERRQLCRSKTDIT